MGRLVEADPVAPVDPPAATEEVASVAWVAGPAPEFPDPAFPVFPDLESPPDPFRQLLIYSEPLQILYSYSKTNLASLFG